MGGGAKHYIFASRRLGGGPKWWGAGAPGICHMGVATQMAGREESPPAGAPKEPNEIDNAQLVLVIISTITSYLKLFRIKRALLVRLNTNTMVRMINVAFLRREL